MYSKTRILEETFRSKFNIDKYMLFAKEFFQNLEMVSPEKENENISYEYRETIKAYREVALYQDPEGKLVDILAVKLSKIGNAPRFRSKQRSFIFGRISAKHHDAAIVAFYSEASKQWRLSLICPDYGYADGKDKLELTPVRRYSYLAGEGEPYHIVIKQLLRIFEKEKFHPTLERIEQAFSVEKVTKDFFEKYKEKYLELKEYLEENQDLQREATEHKLTSEQLAKKLMGQLTFQYFLRKKGWLEGSEKLLWGKGSKSFVRALLQENISLHIPESIFSNAEEKEKVSDRILELFNRYNFTLHEDEPLDREVAVDPEMMGKIFENLLDVKDRKSKGTFYTPREIVHFMCQESIIHYLVKRTGVPHGDMKQFVLFGEMMRDQDCSPKTIHGEKHRVIPKTVYQKLVEIDKALETIKVADEAVA